MVRKNTAATVTTLLCAMLFIVIGSCFSAFVYKGKIIEVKNPNFVLAAGIAVYSGNGDKQINSLELSKMKLGLKPATGEEDVETGIPTTITDKQGSEGQYAKFTLYAPNGCIIYITNIAIKSEKTQEEIMEERENIMVSIKELDGKATSLKEDKVELGRTSATDERQPLTFFIWLKKGAGSGLEASKISFDISIELLA